MFIHVRRNHHNQHNIGWGVLREDLDRLEDKLHDKGMPLMHTWRYHHSSFPNTKAHNHAFDMIQVPTGYKWNVDLTHDSLDVFTVIMF